MACIDLTVGELERDGWLVNQTRMWLASQWSVRHGRDWREGERRFFAHLLDGSRAANLLGWQWVVGTATGRPYGFSRSAGRDARARALRHLRPRRATARSPAWPPDASPRRIAAPAAAGRRSRSGRDGRSRGAVVHGDARGPTGADRRPSG